MPPKVQAKKAGDLEDYSDLATLPQAKIFKFNLVFKSFFSQESRDKVTKRVQENLVATSADKIKTLTRDEIVRYGKEKGTILDQNQLMALPQDDPKRNLSEVEMVARAAADRLFEMSVVIRRAKKEKLLKHEEEINAKGGDDHTAGLGFDLDAVDGLIWMPDYPQTKDEAFALAQCGHSLTGVFEIVEVPRSDAEDPDEDEGEGGSDEDDEDQESHKSQPIDNQTNQQQTTPDSEELQRTMQKIVNQLQIARSLSAVNSSLRQMAIIRVNYKDEPRTVGSKDGDGQTVKKVKSAEDAFLTDLFTSNIDKYAHYYVQYLKFRELVTVEPLMPDKEALAQIRELQHQGEQMQAMLEEQEAHLEEEVATLRDEAKDSDDHAASEKAIEEAKLKISSMKVQHQTQEQERLRAIRGLKKRLKVSLDDEKDASDFNLNTYKKDFVDNAETANNIQSVLSAMISQIENDKVWEAKGSTQMKAKDNQRLNQSSMDDATTMAESLDDLFDEFEHEIQCGLKLRDRGPDPVQGQSLAETLGLKHNKQLQIHEENDRTLEVKQSLPLELVEKESVRVEMISSRERQVLQSLNLPGQDRNLMPAIPTKSQRTRDSENPGFYPFCTLPITDAERMLLLKQFQQLIKQNFIDKGAKGDKRAEKYRVFARTYENHMSPEIFRQVFSDALIDEPDIATIYYPRTDSLLVALYNKTIKKVQTASKPSSPGAENLNEPDGERSWRAAYRVMPDFQNWITFFADEIVFEQEIQVTPPEPEPVVDLKVAPGKDAKKPVEPVEPHHEAAALTISVMKYSMDEDLLPERMLDIEDDKVQNIAEKSALLYPDDNSTMRVDHYMIGGKTFSKSIVVKDNLKFGLRKRNTANDEIKQEVLVRRSGENVNLPDDPSEGLVQYKPVGDTEFWLHFENGTKMGVEQVKMKRLPYKIIRTDPEPPTAAEIAHKEELIRQQAAALAKQKTAKGANVPVVEIEIPKTPEPTFHEKEFNHLDTLFSDDMLENTQSMTTLTLKNGLILQLLGSGEVCQMHDTEIYDGVKDGRREANRLITREGIVIRQLHNRDAEVLYPDGVVACFSKQRMEWIVTNNKGKRVSYKDNMHRDLTPIPCACETDAVTNAKMMIREDNVCTVRYRDGSLYVQHADGTQMHTSADGTQIRIEKSGYAQNVIKIGLDLENNRPSSQPALKTVFQRSLDQRVLETYIPDGSLIQTFLDKVPSKKRGMVESFRHVIKRSDLSVVVADTKGHISLISSNARAALNEAGGKQRLDYTERDHDWLAELTRGAGQFLPGVYQAHVSAKSNKSKIQTKNSEDPTVFTLKSNHQLTKHLTSVTQWAVRTIPAMQSSAPLQQSKGGKKAVEAKAPPPKVVGDLELENVGGWQDPYRKYYTYPRLFVISNNGSARELLAEPQLEYAMRKKKVQIDQSIKQKISDVYNNSSLANHYFLTKVINMKQRELEQQKLNALEFPENAQTVLAERIEVPEMTLLIPKQEQFLYTQIFQLPDCDMMAQEIFLRDYQNYLQWRMGQLRYDTEFAIVHLPESKDKPVDWMAIADEEYANKKINTRILKHRAQPYHKFEPEEFKKSAMKSMAASGEIASYRKNISNRLNSQQRSRQSSQHKSSRDKPASQGGNRREEAVRQSRESTLSGNPLSEENESRDGSMQMLTEKEKAERLKEQQRRVVVQAKLSQNRVKARKEKIGSILEERDATKKTPDFVNKYFHSFSGEHFLKVHQPVEVPPEVLLRMKQRIERSVRDGADGARRAEGDGASIEAGANQRSNDLVMVGEGIDDKHNPIVALGPDDNLKQGSAFLGSKKAGTSIGAGEASLEEAEAAASGNQTLPSLYMQEKMYLYNKEQEALLKAEEHHIVKTKDFNVYGRLREEQINVKSIAKSKAQTELNEKFITTECITDRRVKVSSMAPRYYINAPSVENVRKQGQHQMILSAINKKQTFAELINQANSMVTGVLHDSLKRSLNVMPSSLVFGSLRPGSTNEMVVTVKNEDMMGQRINIKPVTDKRILVRQEEYGMIAPGMIKKIVVCIRVPDDIQVPATVKDTLQIVSKHDIFKLPITAKIISEEEWTEENKNLMATTGKSIQNSRVRERLNRALAESRGSDRRADEPMLLTRKPRKTGQESLKSGDDPENMIDSIDDL